MLKKIAMTAAVFAVSMAAVSVNVASADPMMHDHMMMRHHMMMKHHMMMRHDMMRHRMMMRHHMMHHAM